MKNVNGQNDIVFWISYMWKEYIINYSSVVKGKCCCVIFSLDDFYRISILHSKVWNVEMADLDLIQRSDIVKLISVTVSDKISYSLA
jgi:hypothetical protein